jgi:hypothetical protein
MPLLTPFSESERGGSAVKTFMRVSVIAAKREGSEETEDSEKGQ